MIYFDNAATTAPDPAVLETFNKVYEGFWANPHALHGLGERAEQLLEQARAQVVELLGAEGSRVVFTSGATESNNLAIKGVAELHAARGKHLITTNSEHPSVGRVMSWLEGRGYEVTRLPVGPEGSVSAAQVAEALRKDTILVSTIVVNNETGAINPVSEIGAVLREHSALYHVDAVQAVGKLPFDMGAVGADLVSLSAHKFYGMKGSGVLVLPERLPLPPQLLGGAQEFDLRSGTADVPSAAALAKALRLVVERREEAARHVVELHERLRTGVAELADVIVNSPHTGSPYILNLSIGGVRPESLVHGLSEQGIYVSTASACSSKDGAPSAAIMALCGDEERARHAVRLSLSHLSSAAECATCLNHLETALKTLR